MTERAHRALATIREAQHPRAEQALGLVAAPDGHIDLVLDIPGADDLIFARDRAPVFFVAVELGTRLDGRLLDHDGPPGRARFSLEPARRQVLATENDPALRDFLTIVLEDAGYRVTFATSQIVAEAAALSPDLMLLDGQGRDGDSGWDVLERLKADPATSAIPVMVLTGLGRETEPHAARLEQLGAVLMLKPFDLDDFIAQVRRLAGDPAQRRRPTSSGRARAPLLADALLPRASA